MANIELITRIDASQVLVFDLSRNIDIHAASQARSAERAVDGVTEGHIDLGQEVTWEARHFGVRFEMTSRITEMVKPIRFVDEQVAGPFREWRHLHLFETDDDATRMMDRIDYEAPLGLLGRLTDTLLLNRYLTGLIVRRNEFVKHAAESI